MSSDDLTQVTAVEYDGTVAWQVFAGPQEPIVGDSDTEEVPPRLGDVPAWMREPGLMTWVTMKSATRTRTAGFGGPPLPEGRLINYWHGSADGLPTFVLVRFAPEITTVFIETTTRTISVDATRLVETFGLKFLARPLRDDENLVAVSADPGQPSVPARSLPTGERPGRPLGWSATP